MSEHIKSKWDYILNNQFTKEEVNEIYNDLSKTYDMEVEQLKMQKHKMYAMKMTKIFEENIKEVQILDIGSGTGRLGQQLLHCGFRQIDGLDPAKDMIEIVCKKSTYRNVYNGYIDEYLSEDIKGKYDAVVSCGVVLPNHLPPEHMELTCKVLKPGGLLSFMTRASIFEKDYGEKITKSLQDLEERGILNKIFWEFFDDYHGVMGTKGVFIMYKKLI